MTKSFFEWLNEEEDKKPRHEWLNDDVKGFFQHHSSKGKLHSPGAETTKYGSHKRDHSLHVSHGDAREIHNDLSGLIHHYAGAAAAEKFKKNQAVTVVTKEGKRHSFGWQHGTHHSVLHHVVS